MMIYYLIFFLRARNPEVTLKWFWPRLSHEISVKT